MRGSPKWEPTTIDQVRHLLATIFPRRRVESFELLTGGLCNDNLKIEFASSEAPLVLRIFRRDPTACAREVALLNLVRSTVPVPEVFHSEPEGIPDPDPFPPFALLEFIDGLTFQQLKRTNDLDAIRQASDSVGETLAAIGRFQFPKPGRLIAGPVDGPDDRPSHGLEVGAPYVTGPDPIPTILDTFLASTNFERRAGAALTRRLHDFVWEWASRLPNLDDERSLVHSDFGSRNIMVREVEGKWRCAAVLDWEFAFSGSPLLDVGNFLRYERNALPLREPYFSRAFVRAGGRLPDDWRRIARVIDLTALCEKLTRDELPEDVLTELLELISATVEDRDPHC
jgi:aminoglycoside phosphotransferase (APT) family kinase protein